MSLTSRLKNFFEKMNYIRMYIAGVGPCYSDNFYENAKSPGLLNKVDNSVVETRHSKEYASSITHKEKKYNLSMTSELEK